jgi:hypothetical protein
VRTHDRAVDIYFYLAEPIDAVMCSYGSKPDGPKIVVLLIGEEDCDLLGWPWKGEHMSTDGVVLDFSGGLQCGDVEIRVVHQNSR